MIHAKPSDSALVVELWFIELDQADALVTQCADTLSDTERWRAQRFVHPRDRARYVAGRYAMRCILAKKLNVSPKRIALGVGAQDKPLLIDQENLGFNLSHADGVGVLALVENSCEEGGGAQSSCDVGVDIESKQTLTDPETLFRHCLCTRELDALLALSKTEQHDAFFEIWVRKEASLKALGLGFEVEPHSFDSGWGVISSDKGCGALNRVNIANQSTIMVAPLTDLSTTLNDLRIGTPSVDGLWGDAFFPPRFQRWHGAVALVNKMPLPTIRSFEFRGI